MFFCFATTVRGLENLLGEELLELGASDIQIVNAGLEFRADMQTIMKINLQSRLASRVLIQLAFSGYRSEQDIYNLAKKITWDSWFKVSRTIKVSTNAIRCPLNSINFISLKVKDAICDKFMEQFNERPNVDKTNPDMQIYNFLTADTVTIYLDTSGDTLFKRGYRKTKLEAPIRENLAFGLIKMSGWTPDKVLYDPMCGSGTIVAEAISYGLNMAPGLNRSFAFEKFNNFNKDAWEELKNTAKNQINYQQQLNIFASDINGNAVEIAKSNFEQFEFIKYAKFSIGNFVNLASPATGGVLITNPPYGIRLEEQNSLENLYPLIGSKLKQDYANWDCYFFSGDLRLPKLVRLKPSRKIPIYNGQLDCRLFEFKMVSGSNRKEKI